MRARYACDAYGVWHLRLESRRGDIYCVARAPAPRTVVRYYCLIRACSCVRAGPRFRVVSAGQKGEGGDFHGRTINNRMFYARRRPKALSRLRRKSRKRQKELCSRRMGQRERYRFPWPSVFDRLSRVFFGRFFAARINDALIIEKSVGFPAGFFKLGISSNSYGDMKSVEELVWRSCVGKQVIITGTF